LLGIPDDITPPRQPFWPWRITRALTSGPGNAPPLANGHTWDTWRHTP